MMAHQARKNQARRLAKELGVGYQDAVRILSHPNEVTREALRWAVTLPGITTYAGAMAFLAAPLPGLDGTGAGQGPDDPGTPAGDDDGGESEYLVDDYFAYYDGEDEDAPDPWGCEECGAGGAGNPYGECVCDSSGYAGESDAA